jgi:hypothetical protein
MKQKYMCKTTTGKHSNIGAVLLHLQRAKQRPNKQNISTMPQHAARSTWCLVLCSALERWQCAQRTVYAHSHLSQPLAAHSSTAEHTAQSTGSHQPPATSTSTHKLWPLIFINTTTPHYIAWAAALAGTQHPGPAPCSAYGALAYLLFNLFTVLTAPHGPWALPKPPTTTTGYWWLVTPYFL